ncbi:hypothetical protein [Pyrobaculum aerophilum]|nr:hypothetical protein [Pyrobaculum aerophilum]MCX8137216.1 hypothetical protein [Pyrobaculum aerophilum]
MAERAGGEEIIVLFIQNIERWRYEVNDCKSVKRKAYEYERIS